MDGVNVNSAGRNLRVRCARTGGNVPGQGRGVPAVSVCYPRPRIARPRASCSARRQPRSTAPSAGKSEGRNVSELLGSQTEGKARRIGRYRASRGRC